MRKNIFIIIIILVIGLALYSIIKNNVNEDKKTYIDYEVVKELNDLNIEINNKKERGYEIIQQDEAYYLVIKHGEEPTYFDGLEVVDITGNSKKMNVHVKLIGAGIGDAFSYPKAIIKLKQKPEQVNIIYK